MSYHLRTLAKAGFIEEAPSRGDARERLWRMKIQSFSVRADDDAPVDLVDAEHLVGIGHGKLLADTNHPDSQEEPHFSFGHEYEVTARSLLLFGLK